MNLQDYSNRGFKTLVASSFLPFCFYSQLILANDGVGVKLNTFTNQLFSSSLYSYNKIILAFRDTSDTVSGISPEKTKGELGPWIFYEFIGSTIGGVAGTFVGIGTMDKSPLGLLNAPIGTCIGSSIGTTLAGAIGKQKGNVLGTLIGSTIGTILVYGYLICYYPCDSPTNPFVWLFFWGAPPLGAVIGYNF